ncbi:MAG: PAS domain S-box protein [Deltaproteobacteria bacterium]|nr:PAS domain S-box protein [Deltaproteobacteria bacterium]
MFASILSKDSDFNLTNLSHFRDWPLRLRWGLVGAITLIYALIFIPLAKSLGQGALALTGLPLVTGGLFLGVRLGLLFAVALIAAITIAHLYFGFFKWNELLQYWPRLLMGLSTPIFIGAMSDLLKRMREQSQVLNEEITERKKIEEAVYEERQKFQTLSENAPFGMVLIGQDGTFKYVNPKFIELFGYNLKEVPDIKSWRHRAFPDASYRQRVISCWLEDQQKFKPGERKTRTFTAHCHDGTEKIVKVITVQIPGGDYLLTYEDLTEFKRAEESLLITKFSVDRAAEGIAWIGPTGQFLYVNDKICQYLGYSQDELLSRTLFDVDPDLPREQWERHWQDIKQNGGSTFRTCFNNKEGRSLPVEINVNYLEYQDKEFYIAFTRDISEHIQSQERLKRQYDRLAALRSIDTAITASLDLRVTFNVFLDQVVSQLGMDAADVLLLDPLTFKLRFMAGRGFKTSALQYTQLSLGEGYAGQAALNKSLIRIENLKATADSLKRSPLFREEGFVTYLGQPLIAKAQVVGVLEVFHRSPFNPDQEWLDFFEALTGQAAIAIENASLFSDLQKSNLDLLQAYDTTLEGWSRALDLRDEETEGHSQRVTEMTLQLAREYGNMAQNELRSIRWGALLHDIGKMGIPDSILSKPGPLTGKEWEIMQRHPVHAYNLLYPITFLRSALDIPYCHHEKWDGTGYPKGLKGEQIPLPARIFAVIDVWDALRSGRPYRPAWTEDKARAYILEQRGKHFDPKVVDVFMNLEMIIDS